LQSSIVINQSGTTEALSSLNERASLRLWRTRVQRSSSTSELYITIQGKEQTVQNVCRSIDSVL
jgi:hypothetical protein